MSLVPDPSDKASSRFKNLDCGGYTHELHMFTCPSITIQQTHFRQSTSINILPRCLMDINRAAKLAKFSDVSCLSILEFPCLWQATADQDQVN